MGVYVRSLVFLGLLLIAAAVAFPQAPSIYTVTIIVEPPEGGMVTGEGRYAAGALVTVKAEPYPGYEFVGWWEEGVEVCPDPEYSFTITSDRVLIARFEPVLFFEGTKFYAKGKLELVPDLQFLSGYGRLLSGYRFNGVKWRLGTTFSFRGSSFVGLTGSLDLRFRRSKLSGRIGFDPQALAYRYAYLSLFTRAEDFVLFSSVRHSAHGLSYAGSLRSGAFNLKASFVEDADGGVQFQSAVLRISRFPLCCDIGSSFVLSFTKEGFSYLKLKIRNLLELCCDISFNLYVEFTPNSKSLSLEPVWKYVRACLKVYGDVDWTGQAIEGIEIHGFKIACGPKGGKGYPRLELVTALSPEKLPWARFREGELEYVGAEFRGPGCCGGVYELALRTYFSHAGGPFGISRVLIEGEVPLGDFLTLELSFTGDLATPENKVELGWEMDL